MAGELRTSPLSLSPSRSLPLAFLLFSSRPAVLVNYVVTHFLVCRRSAIEPVDESSRSRGSSHGRADSFSGSMLRADRILTSEPSSQPHHARLTTDRFNQMRFHARCELRAFRVSHRSIERLLLPEDRPFFRLTSVSFDRQTHFFFCFFFFGDK